ncbi:MAG: DNA polymerase III subunit alpha [bacterium]
MDFIHLHVHSDGSFLDSTATPEALLAKAQALGMNTLALTDRDSLARAVEFFRLAPRYEVRPLLGVELSCFRGEPERLPRTALLLVENEIGYAHLLVLLNAARLEGPIALPPQVSWREVMANAEGLHLLLGQGESLLAPLLSPEKEGEARSFLGEARQAFGPRLHLELSWHGEQGEASRVRRLLNLGKRLAVPTLVANDVHFLEPADQALYEIVCCIRTLTRRGEPHPAKRSGSNCCLRPAAEMAQAFASCPQALRHTVELAESLRFCFPPFSLRLPHAGLTPQEETGLLRQVCLQRLPDKYPGKRPDARQRLEDELGWIERLGYAGYFLLVWDLVEEAQRREIAVFGRGSAASSIVSYLLHITWVDPLAEGLLFERFLNPERRQDPPDIDLDIDWNRREELMDYVRAKYGAERIVHVGGFATFRLQGALQAVGKALGKGKQEIDQFQREARQGQTCSEEARSWLSLAQRLVGQLHHLTTHPCGFVISRGPVRQELPLAVTPEGVVTQYDMHTLAALGFLKMDFLGSRSLAIVEETLKSAGSDAPAGTALARVRKAGEIPIDDAGAWEMIAKGRTLGVFQLESSGLRSLLMKLQPRSLGELAAALSLYRPGPLQGGMMQPFVRRHRGEEAVRYLHPLLQPILQETYGVVLYQEQVMQVARQLGGLTLGEADILRKAMGEKDAEAIRLLQPRFLEGAQKRGVEERVALEAFTLLEKFAGYGFNKAHSASYAIVAYRNAWLKRHYPAHFFAVLLSTQMGYYPSFVYTQEAVLSGISVLAPDINRSQAACTLENVCPALPSTAPMEEGGKRGESGGIRLGLAYLKDLGPAQIGEILRLRPPGGFTNLEDLCLRLYPLVDRGALAALIQGGALDCLGFNRPTLLARLSRAIRLARDKGSLFAPPEEGPDFHLEPFSPSEEASLSWQATEIYLPNPLALHRAALAPYSPEGGARLRQLKPGSTLKAAAILVHYRLEKTRGGERMAFLCLFDLAGQWEAVLLPAEARRFALRLRARSILLLEGEVVERQGAREFVLRQLTPWNPPEEGGRAPLPDGLRLSAMARVAVPEKMGVR